MTRRPEADTAGAAPPWDPGLQNERTGLAWQRTMLSGLACGLLMARLLTGVSVALAVIVALLALGGTATLGWVALRRFRRTSRLLHADRPVGGALPQALITAVLLVAGVAALIYLVAL